jgi:hypothetical protein
MLSLTRFKTLKHKILCLGAYRGIMVSLRGHSLNQSDQKDGRLSPPKPEINMDRCYKCEKGMHFKSWYRYILDGKQLKMNYDANSNRMLRYIIVNQKR